MPLIINLHLLERNNLVLQGELPVAELELELHDEVIQALEPLCYELEVQQLEEAVLAQGKLSLRLDCQCVRCLQPFKQSLELAQWACHLPLEGEDKVPVVSDSVDLTPFLREDILLAFPQHPLCKPDCCGLAGLPKKTEAGSGVGEQIEGPSPWAALDKLKLK